jgi:hypothetical protein
MRQTAAVWAVTLATLPLVPATAHAANSKKGSFAKCTNGGAPCDNVVAHGLGETPKAVILWTTGKTNESFSGSYLFAFGVTDGTTSRSAAAASLDADARPNASRRMASKALTIVEWGEITRAEADLLSWDRTSFTLRWTTNINVAYVVHFIAIGGGDVSAKVLSWPTGMPTSPDANFAVTGVGFQPDVVLHVHTGDSFTGAPGTSARDSAFGLGVMTAAGDQWAVTHFTVDGANNGSDSDSQRGQQTDSCIFAIDAALGITKKASFVSMDPNGFTVNFTTANTTASQIFSLALKGISARAANFPKTTTSPGPVSQTVADVGFRPDVVLLSSFQDVAQGSPVAHSRFGIGASDGTNEGSSTFVDQDALPTSSVDTIDKTSKVFVKVNNGAPVIDAEADLTGVFNAGFTLNWSTNDAVATEILYLALGQDWQQSSEAQVVSGSYKGNAVDNRAIKVGFVPDFVIVKGDTAQVGVFRTSTMSGDSSKEAFGATALNSNWIQSIDSAGGGGFTVGTDARVNGNGVMYYWTAFKAGTGKMVVGSYTGDGSATPPAITGPTINAIGFAPEVVFVMSAGGHNAIHRSSAPNATGAFDFFDSAPIASTVTLGQNGFTVGTDSHVNASGTVYHWVAWNEVAGYMDVGNYTGDTQASRAITGVGFEPEFLIQKRVDGGGHTHQRPASLAASTQDDTLRFDASASLCCRIQQLLSDGFQVNQQWNTNADLAEYFYYAWKRTTQPFVVSGSYTGNGAASQQITGLRFTPDVVIVKGNVADVGVIKTSAMTGTNAKPMTGLTAVTANLIQIDASGFSVFGTDARTNSATACGGACTYYWIAFKGAPGTMEVGSYTGNGTSQPVPAVGSSISFSPELVFIMSNGPYEAVHESSASTETHNFQSSGNALGPGVTLTADGFTVNNANDSVNRSATTYYYVVWNEIPGEMDVGSYIGNGSDNRSITGVRFEPEYVVIKRYGANSGGIFATHHPASLGRSNDEAMWFYAAVNTTPGGNRIQKLLPDGFEVGNQVVVNQCDDNDPCAGAQNAEYMYYAWKRPEVSALTAVRLTAFAATRYDRGVLVQWQTGYEVDNLGFHVYREVNGQRARVTRSLVAGSGLMAGQGTAMTTERRYAIWDLAATDRSAVYWLEDLDFNGTSTWHGPVTPVDGGLQAPPDMAPSEALHDLGKGAKRRGKTFLTEGARLDLPWKPGHRKAAATATETQWALAGEAAVKIGITRPGWYRVPQPELVAAGLDPSVDPRRLRLFVDGLEQAMTVTGEADGRFEAGDAIEFYGRGLDTPFTDTHVYWLAATGSGAARRMRVHGAAPGGAQATTAGSFPFTVQQKERSIYFAALVNGDAENWFGSLVYEEPTDLTFNVSNPDLAAGAPADLEITLRGITSTPDVDPDHQVSVRVNGTEVGELRFNAQGNETQTFAVPAGVLREGANTVTMVARGGEEDYSLVDVVRLRYGHTYRADADLLRFTADGPGTVTVAGFASPAIRVVDMTDPLAPEESRGAVSQDGGLWAVTVRVPGSGPRTLMAFTDATVAAPAFVRANHPSRWHAAANAADYVAIAHAEFGDWVAPLLARRERQGLATARVDVEDVYDEFSFGEKTPQALKEFVRHARASWTRSPRFLLLVGDATFDPRDYAGFGDGDFVPTPQVPLVHFSFEAASDDWYADLDDDGVPELAVGRLSVRTGPQAERIAAKILAYEDGGEAVWTKDVLLVADQNEGATDFEHSAYELGALVPSAYRVHRVFRGVSGPDASRHELLEAVSQGQLIVNYLGHGSLRVWGKDGRLLTSADVRDTWRNAARLPLVVAMSCLNGFFYDIYDEESLAETFLRAPEGGAVAAWASSGITESSAQMRANQELLRLLFGQPRLTVGEAVAAAKRAVPDRDVRRSWIFFGDPAMRLLGVASSTQTQTDSPAAEAPATARAEAGSDGDPAADDAASSTEQAMAPVRLADFNADGRDDELLYDHVTGRWSLVLNERTGQRIVDGAWPAHAQLFPAHLDADRFVDVFVYAPATGQWSQALNNGDGTFRLTSGVWAANWQVRVANFAGDTRDEVFLYQPLTGEWLEAAGDGKGGFTYRSDRVRVGGELSVADFNRDALADLFLGDRASASGWVAVNDGVGGFSAGTEQWSYTWPARATSLGGRSTSLAASKAVDLVLYDARSGLWAERLANATPSAFRSGAWSAGLAIGSADFSGDGADDLLLYDPRTGAWSVLINTSSGLLGSQSGAWSPGLRIATGDLDGDGRAEVLLHDVTSHAWTRCASGKSGTFTCGDSGAWDQPWTLVGYHP